MAGPGSGIPGVVAERMVPARAAQPLVGTDVQPLMPLQ